MKSLLSVILLTAATCAAAPPPRVHHNLERLTLPRLKSVRHWDAKKDQLSLLAFATKLTDPVQFAEFQEAVRLYPDAVLAFQCDYPRVYLDKWDKETRRMRLTGVAANDCHHNQVMLVKMVDAESVRIGTNVDKDEQMRLFTAEQRPGIREMTRGRHSGDLLAKLDLDPYFRSFANSATHVLAPRLDEAAIRTALKSGHAFVAHDWMSDATGFRFEATGAGGERAAIMGDEIKPFDGLKLSAKLPLPAFIRVLREGTEILTADGKADIEFEVKESGVYRLEAWLKLDGELRPWIYSNPIYVR